MQFTKTTSALILTLLIITNGISINAQKVRPSEGFNPRVQNILKDLRKKGNYPGLTFSYRFLDQRNGSTAVGYSDREAKISMRPNDKMLSGSIGKTYVAAVMLSLIDNTNVKLDDSIKKWLVDEPWFDGVANAKETSIRMLLNHTSGIRAHVNEASFAKMVKSDPTRFWKPDEQIKHIVGKPAWFKLGIKHRYSESNYTILGILIEKITGEKYYDVLTKRFLSPLKLKNTKPSDTRKIDGLITGYTRANNPWGIPVKNSVNGVNALNPQIEWTGGGLVSTSDDLTRWAVSLYGNDILGKGMKTEMLTGVSIGQQFGDLKPIEYGLGVYIRHTKLGPVYGHGGDFPGYHSFMFYYSKLKLAVALQFNQDSFALSAPTLFAAFDDIARILSGIPIAKKMSLKTESGYSVKPLTTVLKGGTGGIAVDKNSGFIYVADFREKVYRISPQGKVVLFANGLKGSSGNAVDSEGNLFQSNIRSGVVNKITPDGKISVFSTGHKEPIGIAIDNSANLFVANCTGNSIRKVTKKGVSSVFAKSNLFNCPNGITFDDLGNLFVANYKNGKILKVTPNGKVSSIANIPGGGNGHIVFTNDVFYITGREGNQIFKLTKKGNITLIGGTGERGTTDGNALEAKFSLPNGIAASPNGDKLYINEFLGVRGNVPNKPPSTNIVRQILVKQ